MKYNDNYARWSYEQLLLQQSHIEFKGLWKLGGAYFIDCPRLEEQKTLSGEKIDEWFDNNCRVITANAKIVSEIPVAAEKVPERSVLDRIELAGSPRNLRDLLVDVNLKLPRDFPHFLLGQKDGSFRVTTKHPISEIQQDEIAGIFNQFEYFLPVTFCSDPSLNETRSEPFRYKFGNGDINLIPGRLLRDPYSASLKHLIEDDDDFWTTTKKSVLGTFHRSPLLPGGWGQDGKLGCFVDASVSKVDNIRNYLSMYDVVHLAMPLEVNIGGALAALGISHDDMVALASLGRLRIILPQAIDRYPLGLLNTLADAAPESLLFSRRLAAATVSSLRERIPLLYAPVGPRQRYEILHALSRILSESPDKNHAYGYRVIAELGAIWSKSENSLQTLGAMGVGFSGISPVASAVYKHGTGKDIALELWGAAHKVEWSIALGSHVFPHSSEVYNENPACEFIAGLYSPVWGRGRGIVPPLAMSAVADVLSIDNNAPVIEFAKEFESAEIERFRRVIFKLSGGKGSAEELAVAVRDFNAAIRHYEKRPGLLKALNLIGMVSAQIASSVDPTLTKLVSPMSFFLKFIFDRLIDELPRKNAYAGQLIDYLNSALTGKPNADAVLVSRIRSDISKIK
jgi:hypothetical protein